MELYNDTIINILNSGHEIGNHTYNHKWLTKLNEEDMLEQINKTQDLFKEKYNYNLKYLRPTYGSVNNRLKKVSELEIVKWTVDSNDWKIKNPDTIVNNILDDVDNYDIILFHDTYEWTLKTIEKLVSLLIDSGYQLVTLSDLKENM